MSRVIYTVFSEDARDWSTYLEGVITQDPSNKYEFRSTLASDLVKNSASSVRLDVEDAEVLVVILSPQHRAFLDQNPEFNYHELVRGGKKGVLFACGISAADLEANGRDIISRFPWYRDWATVDHSDSGNLVATIDGMKPFSSLTYQLVPSKVRSEGDTLVTVSFSDVIAAKPSDLKMVLYLSSNSGASGEDQMQVTWLNDKTVYFKAPERKEGKVKVRIMVDGNPVVGTDVLNYESSCELISDIMQVYMQAMDQLFCALLSKSLMSSQDLDALLHKFFSQEELKGVQPKAFEEVFGIFRHNAEGTTLVELPTLLHFAQKFGLTKFKSWLDVLPDAPLAADIRNSEGLSSSNIKRFSAPAASRSQFSTKPQVILTRQADSIEEENESEDDEDYLIMDQHPASRDLASRDHALPPTSLTSKLYGEARKPVVKIGAETKTPDEDDDDSSGDSYIEVMGEKINEDEDIYDTCDLVEEDEVEEAPPPMVPAKKPEVEKPPEPSPVPAPLPPRRPSLAPVPTMTMPSMTTTGSSSAAAVSIDARQQRLIELMNQYKAGELTMEEVNILFEEWKINHAAKPGSRGDKKKNYEMTVPAMFPVVSVAKETKPLSRPPMAVPESASRAIIKRGSNVSDKHSSTASTSSVDSLWSTATSSSSVSRSSGIEADANDGDVSSRRSSSGSMDGGGGSSGAPPLPARCPGPRAPAKGNAPRSFPRKK